MIIRKELRKEMRKTLNDKKKMDKALDEYEISMLELNRALKTEFDFSYIEKEFIQNENKFLIMSETLKEIIR